MNARSCFFALALMLAPHAASAFDELEIKNAQTRFDEGRALAAKGQYDEARLKFVQAYAVLQSPDSLYNLAYTEKRSLHIVEAIRHFRVLLRDEKTPADLREKAQGFIGDLAKTTSHVNVTAPNGADVAVDGTIVGRAPLADPVDVLSGQHTFTATLESKRGSSDLRLDDGETTSITLEIPGVTSSGTSNGTPQKRTELYRPAEGWIVPGIVGAVGVVGLGLGIGFGIASSNAASDAKSSAAPGICVTPSSACTTFRDHASTANSAGVISIVGYVSGGVLVASAAVMALIWPSKQREIVVAPTVTTQGAGLTLLGRF